MLMHYVLALLLIYPIATVHAYEDFSNHEISVAKWKFHEFSTHITVMVFLLITVLIKIGFRKIPYWSEYVPESLLLIIIGVVFGAIVRHGIYYQSQDDFIWRLTPRLFFDYLLPPIMLESAYSLYNRTFSEYLGVILIFAVLGTIINFLLIGFLMFFLYNLIILYDARMTLDLKGFLLFSSLIVAVDPVAVLAIFHEIRVELSLYYIVFGESLFNDAITVVLYEIMAAFVGQETVDGRQIALGVVSFFTVSFGGLFIGVLFGIVTCLITRIQSHLNSFTLILLAYFSYIMADCLGWSGIISMIGCGLIQAAYAFHNLDKQSVVVVHRLTKVVAEVSEAVIFLFLGFEVVSPNLEWNVNFMICGLLVCLVARTAVIVLLSAIVNLANVDGTNLSWTEQAIVIYGGLRGAVAFSLAVLIPAQLLGDHGEYKQQVFVTSTLFVILFTVGFMGVTIKPLVKLLKIRLDKTKTLSLFAILNNSVVDSSLGALEIMLNQRGRNVVREFFLRLDAKYLRKLLQRNPEYFDERLFKVYEDIALKLHNATIRPEMRDQILQDIPEGLRQKLMLSQSHSSSNLPSNVLSNWSPDFNTDRFVRQSKMHQLDCAIVPADDKVKGNKSTLESQASATLDFDETFMDMIRIRRRTLMMNRERIDKIDLHIKSIDKDQGDEVGGNPQDDGSVDELV